MEPAELAVLRASLPTGLRTDDAPVVVNETARAALQARDVIDADGTVHRSVLAGLVLLADPAAVHVSVVAAGPATVRRTSMALSEHLLAGLTVEEPSGRAEQFLARNDALADEVVRLLPDLGVPGTGARRGLNDVEPGLLMAAVARARSGHPPEPLAGIEPGSSGEAPVAQELADGFVGSMSVTLSVPSGAIADAPVLDRVLWVATAGGWWSLRPKSDREGVARLDVLPVDPGGLGRELAPMIAAAALALSAPG